MEIVCTVEGIDSTRETILKRLARKTLTQSSVTPRSPVIIEDYDLDRIYMKIDGLDYIIRTWNVYETKKSLVFEWSLYYYKPGEDSGTTLGSGVTRFSLKKYFGENEE